MEIKNSFCSWYKTPNNIHRDPRIFLLNDKQKANYFLLVSIFYAGEIEPTNFTQEKIFFKWLAFLLGVNPSFIPKFKEALLNANLIDENWTPLLYLAENLNAIEKFNSKKDGQDSNKRGRPALNNEKMSKTEIQARWRANKIDVDKNKTDVDKNKTDVDKNKIDVDKNKIDVDVIVDKNKIDVDVIVDKNKSDVDKNKSDVDVIVDKNKSDVDVIVDKNVDKNTQNLSTVEQAYNDCESKPVSNVDKNAPKTKTKTKTKDKDKDKDCLSDLSVDFLENLSLAKKPDFEPTDFLKNSNPNKQQTTNPFLRDKATMMDGYFKTLAMRSQNEKLKEKLKASNTETENTKAVNNATPVLTKEKAEENTKTPTENITNSTPAEKATPELVRKTYNKTLAKTHGVIHSLNHEQTNKIQKLIDRAPQCQSSQFWIDYFQTVKNTPFLNGQIYTEKFKKGFKPKLTWLIDPNRIENIINGDYKQFADN